MELRSLLKNGLKTGDVLVVGDLDELPSRASVQLVKHCTVPQHLAFDLPTHVGSFAWRLSAQHNVQKCVARTYDAKLKNTDWIGHHKQQGNTILLDAGWHCSWCFRYLSQYAEKLLSYAHNDRPLLGPGEVQRRLCAGITMESLWYEWPPQQEPHSSPLPLHRNATFLFDRAQCLRERWDPRLGLGGQLVERYGRAPASWSWWARWRRSRELQKWVGGVGGEGGGVGGEDGGGVAQRPYMTVVVLCPGLLGLACIVLRFVRPGCWPCFVCVRTTKTTTTTDAAAA